MIQDIPISVIMTEEVLILDAQDSVWEAEKTFNNHHIRHAPVVEGGELVGMLSWIDLKKLLPSTEWVLVSEKWESQQIPDLQVHHIMTPEPVSVQSQTTLREVAEILSDNEFHALPVLDGERVVGIVSTTDLIRFLMDNCR